MPLCRRSAVLLASALLVPAAPARATRGEKLARLLLDRDFPDPGVLTLDGTFHAYGTNSGGVNIQHASATDLAGPWQYRGDAMPPSALPGWVGPNANGFRHIWAPDVSRRADGTFLLYYAAFNPERGAHCVGAATSASPGGPFAPAGARPLLCGPGGGAAIDPAAFVDADGSRYLLYKDTATSYARRGPSTIRLRPVTADGLDPRGRETIVLRADRAEEAGVVEAPTLVRRPGGYVLFYSANVYDSGHYFTGYATADRITGPYRKANAPLLSKSAFGGRITDPGHQDVVSTGSHIFFHGDLAGPGGPRGMYVAGLRWEGLHPVLTGFTGKTAR